MTTAPTITVNMPRLYPKQHEAIFDPARYAVIEASTKAGKTLGCIVWQASRVMADTRKMNHWWVAPVYPQSAIAYKRAKRMFRDLYRANDSEMTLTFRNGATWCFKSGEKPDNLYGEDVESAVIDEFTRLREESWHAVRSTVTATRGPVRFIGNVKGRGNWGYRMARRAEGGAQGYAYHKITAQDAIDAGVLDAAEIEDARRGLPDEVFRQLYFCEPADDGGNPFGMQAIAACVRPLSQKPPVAFGVDLAKSVDWNWVVGLDEDGAVCVSERWQGDWGGTHERVLALVNGWPALVDSTGVGNPLVENMQRVRSNVEGFVFSATSKQQLMEGLMGAIQQRQVAFPDGLLRQELESFEYEYRPSGGVRYEAPAGLHDDGVCALALAVECKRRAGRHVLDAWVLSAGDEDKRTGDEWANDDNIWRRF